jgi:hypothetical protein
VISYFFTTGHPIERRRSKFKYIFGTDGPNECSRCKLKEIFITDGPIARRCRKFKCIFGTDGPNECPRCKLKEIFTTDGPIARRCRKFKYVFATEGSTECPRCKFKYIFTTDGPIEHRCRNFKYSFTTDDRIEPSCRKLKYIFTIDDPTQPSSSKQPPIYNPAGPRIRVLPIPPLLQPFDVAVASPLEVAYHKLFAHERRELEKQFEGRPILIHRIRYAMCRPFIGAYPQAITMQKAQAGFMKAGIVPCNPEEPKQSGYCPDTTEQTRLYRIQLKSGLANNRLLTSDEEIERLRRPEAHPPDANWWFGAGKEQAAERTPDNDRSM